MILAFPLYVGHALPIAHLALLCPTGPSQKGEPIDYQPTPEQQSFFESHRQRRWFTLKELYTAFSA